MNYLSAFDAAFNTANTWFKELDEDLGWNDPDKLHSAVRGVLHVLRDRLPAVEALHLGAQLPLLIAGVYYDGWAPREKPLRIRSAEEFVDTVGERLPAALRPNSDEAVKAVFRLLGRHVSMGEIADVGGTLPEELRVLWTQTAVLGG